MRERHEYLESHAVGREASTIQTLCERLRYAEQAFGARTLRELEHCPSEIADWRRTLPEGSHYGGTQALRQALGAAARWNYISKNPAKLAGRNTQPKRAEIEPFTLKEIEKLAAELGRWGPMVKFAAATGLRPCEWIALEHRDIDRAEGVVRVERSFSRGVQKSYGKTTHSRRRVPLSGRAFEAIGALPRGINTRLVFPAPGGGGGVKSGHGAHLDLHNWRSHEWHVALNAAGLPKRRIYDLRHSFATQALAAGISIFELSRFMGTSLQMIDATYGHLAHGSEAAARGRPLSKQVELIQQDPALRGLVQGVG